MVEPEHVLLDRGRIRALDAHLEAVGTRGELVEAEVELLVLHGLGVEVDRRTRLAAVDEDLHDSVIDGLRELGQDPVPPVAPDGKREDEPVDGQVRCRPHSPRCSGGVQIVEPGEQVAGPAADALQVVNPHLDLFDGSIHAVFKIDHQSRPLYVLQHIV